MMSSDEFQAKQRHPPPRRLLGLICRLPAGLVSPNSTRGIPQLRRRKKNYKKPNQNRKLGASLTLSHKRAQQRLEPACCDCSVCPHAGQIFKAVGVSQFAQAMSERTHIQHRRARG